MKGILVITMGLIILELYKQHLEAQAREEALIIARYEESKKEGQTRDTISHAELLKSLKLDKVSEG